MISNEHRYFVWESNKKCYNCSERKHILLWWAGNIFVNLRLMHHKERFADTRIDKGGFYSEDTDVFVISSNRQTLLFSWAWILKLWDFKGLKSCYISAWSGSEGSNKALFYYLSLQSCFGLLFDMISVHKNITNSKFKLRKIIRFVCLRKWQMHQYLLKKSHL